MMARKPMSESDISRARIANAPDVPFDYLGFGHRLRVTRIALGLTEEQAAAAAGCTVRTWRKNEATGKGRTGPLLLFCTAYKVDLGWIFEGETRRVSSHLAVAIFPAKGWSVHRAKRAVVP
jgi:hypothetical protein